MPQNVGRIVRIGKNDNVNSKGNLRENLTENICNIFFVLTSRLSYDSNEMVLINKSVQL